MIDSRRTSNNENDGVRKTKQKRTSHVYKRAVAGFLSDSGNKPMIGNVIYTGIVSLMLAETILTHAHPFSRMRIWVVEAEVYSVSTYRSSRAEKLKGCIRRIGRRCVPDSLKTTLLAYRAARLYRY